MLANICDAKEDLFLYCNDGTMLVTKKGDQKGFGTVWYGPDGIGNLMCLNNVKNKYRVTYDSKQDDRFVVHNENGTKNKGLFYLDMRKYVRTVLVHTVDSNKSKYSFGSFPTSW